MGVGVERQDGRTDEVFDEAEGASGGGVVGIGEPTRPERPDYGFVASDDRAADGENEFLGLGGEFRGLQQHAGLLERQITDLASLHWVVSESRL